MSLQVSSITFDSSLEYKIASLFCACVCWMLISRVCLTGLLNRDRSFQQLSGKHPHQQYPQRQQGNDLCEGPLLQLAISTWMANKHTGIRKSGLSWMKLPLTQHNSGASGNIKSFTLTTTLGISKYLYFLCFTVTSCTHNRLSLLQFFIIYTA